MIDFKIKIRVKTTVWDAEYELIVKAESTNDAIEKTKCFIINSFQSYNYLISEPEPIFYNYNGVAVFYRNLIYLK